jgi:signal transduction histidine kinase
VGGHLLNLMVRGRNNQLQGPDLVRGLESCLNDLRLIVGSLDAEERSLEVSMAELKHRTQVHCESAGVELVWDSASAEGIQLSMEHTLSLLRAVQEMLTNALRHSGARRIEVRLQTTALHASISVRDDGVGFDFNHVEMSGRGLSNLKMRARDLGGRLSFSPALPGSRVSLEFPLALHRDVG